MKKNLFSTFMMFVALATVALTSCSKDPEELILGDWNAESIVMSASMGGMGMNMDITEGCVKFSFSEDGILTWCMKEVDDLDDMMNPIWGTYIDTMLVPYTLDGDVLTLMPTDDIGDVPMKLNVNVLEKDELSLESVPFEIDGGITSVVKFSFTK